MPDKATWRKQFNAAYDPLRGLTLDECRRLYVGRSGQPSARLVEALVDGEPQRTRIALVGARGCGKSTELRKVMATLSRDGAELVPILVDISDGLPDHATTVAWLPVVSAAVRAAREDWNGAAPASDPLPAALAAVGVTAETLAGLMQVVRVVGPWLGPQGQVASTVTAPLGELTSWLGRAARAAAEHSDEREPIEAIVDALRAELVALQAAAGRTPVLLLDGLDKRASADAVFAALSEAELLFGLPAALVISGPMALRLDPRFASFLTPGYFEPVTLHNLPVVDRQGAPKAEGIEVLRELHERRWHAAGLSPPLLPTPLVDQAARWSSGIVREFLLLLRETGKAALRTERREAVEADLAAAVRERRHTLEITLDAERWDVLAHVLEEQERPSRDLDDLLYYNAVVCYQNDSVWYRPNELLVPYLQQRRRDDPA